MIKNQLNLYLSPEAKISRHLTGQVRASTLEPRPSRRFTWIVVAAAAAAAFVAMYSLPASAGGSMAPEVRVIVVQPSSTIRKIDRIHEMNKAAKARAKEEALLLRDKLKAEQRRRLEADKAYYKRLEAQRKGKK